VSSLDGCGHCSVKKGLKKTFFSFAVTINFNKTQPEEEHEKLQQDYRVQLEESLLCSQLVFPVFFVSYVCVFLRRHFSSKLRVRSGCNSDPASFILFPFQGLVPVPLPSVELDALVCTLCFCTYAAPPPPLPIPNPCPLLLPVMA